jgi:hypothetical protein
MRTAASSRRRGQALPLLMVFALMIGGGAVLAFDAARYFMAQREIYNAAVSAARAGAQRIDTSQIALCPVGSADCGKWLLFDHAGDATHRSAEAEATYVAQCWIGLRTGGGAACAMDTGFAGVAYSAGSVKVSAVDGTGAIGTVSPRIYVTITACVDNTMVSLLDLLGNRGSAGCPQGATKISATANYQVEATY